ncbi:MAG: FliG C-terminal domain-containing protein [Bacteriovoracaceae bacterium]
MLKGIKGAIKVLNALDPMQRDKVLEIITAQDSILAEELKKNLVSLDDITQITVPMLVDFTREISLKDLGLALRVAQEETKDFILENVSASMKEEIEEGLLGKPVPLKDALIALEKVMIVFREKVEKGDIVLGDTDTIIE